VARKSRIHASRPRTLASIDWNQDFAGLPAVKLPDGRKLETLAERAAYIVELPKKQQQEAQWQRVTALLLRAAEDVGGWPFLARVSFSDALHGVSGVGPPPTPPDKNAAWKAKRAARKR
jgi:hypothetical protein